MTFQSSCPRARRRANVVAWLAFLCVCLMAVPAFGSTTTVRANPRFHAIDPDTGSALVGGKLQSYLCGTTTPSSTYADYTGTVANANPVIMDGSGEANVWLDPAICYKLVLKTSADVVIWTLDGINTAAAGSFTTLSASGAATFSSTLSVSGAATFLSTIAVTGTASFGVITTSSSALVANLNASQLVSATWASPPATGYGSTSPAPVAATTVTASGAVAISTADGLTVNSKIIPQTWTVEFYLFGTMVDAHAWIAPRACKVVSVKEIHSVVGGASAAVRPRKITDTSAPGAVASGTVKEITTANFDLTAVVNTTQTGTLSATASDYTFASGDKLSLDMSGTVAGTVGIIVVEFQAQ
jgi:hypothetical protein